MEDKKKKDGRQPFYPPLRELFPEIPEEARRRIMEVFGLKKCEDCAHVVTAWNRSGVCRPCYDRRVMKVRYARIKQKIKAVGKKCTACGEDVPAHTKRGLCVVCRAKAKADERKERLMEEREEMEKKFRGWEAICLDCKALFTGRVHPLDEVCVKCGSTRVRRAG